MRFPGRSLTWNREISISDGLIAMSINPSGPRAAQMLAPFHGQTPPAAALRSALSRAARDLEDGVIGPEQACERLAWLIAGYALGQEQAGDTVVSVTACSVPEDQ